MNPETPPEAEEQTRQAGEGAGKAPPPSNGKDETAELLELLARLRARVEPLGKDLLAWAQAEARLREFEFRERARLAITRIVLLLLAVIPGITAWLFLNVTIWRVAGALTGMGWTAPLAVTLVNALVAFVILLRVDKLHL